MYNFVSIKYIIAPLRLTQRERDHPFTTNELPVFVQESIRFELLRIRPSLGIHVGAIQVDDHLQINLLEFKDSSHQCWNVVLNISIAWLYRDDLAMR